jgi:ATP-dependent RNA helicase DeaD
MEKFKTLGLSESMLATLKLKGFAEPTTIQTTVIPAILNETDDIIAQAQTGTGKTAAFAIPLIELLKAKTQQVQVLIMTPTRELAQQVSREFESLDINRKLKVLCVYGGQSIEVQLKSLRRGVDVVVGTPGRLLDHLRRKSLSIAHLAFLILDEADEMLNMGFAEDMEAIMKQTGTEKRTLLFSATMPQRIVSLAKTFMKKQRFIKSTQEQQVQDLTDQIYFEVKQNDKFEALCRIIDIEHTFYGLVFCRTKIDVDVLSKKLLDRGYNAEALHGDIAQPKREVILDRFRKKKLTILVATDVAARGIDIINLSHVINYSLPQDIESYIHRIGRTGRAGNRGTAITFITPSEYRYLLQIQQMTRSKIRKATVPDIKEVIRTKRARVTEELEMIVSLGSDTAFGAWSDKLLAKYEARDLVAALLKYSFEEELDERNYGQIGKPENRMLMVDTKGTTRLFVSLGTNDGYTKHSIAGLLQSNSKNKELNISDVRLFDRFSLVTVPFTDAEDLIVHFSDNPKGAAKNEHHRVMVRRDVGRSPRSKGAKAGKFKKDR